MATTQLNRQALESRGRERLLGHLGNATEAEKTMALKGYVDFWALVTDDTLANIKYYTFGQKMAYSYMIVNPLGYYCAPNQASYEYVTAHDIESFVAAGMFDCYQQLQHVEGYTPDGEDYYYFRRCFFAGLDEALEVYSEMEVAEYWDDDRGSNPDMDFTFTSDADRAKQLNDDSDPTNELVFKWGPRLKTDDGAMCLDLSWYQTDGKGSDDTGRWIAAEILTPENKEKWGGVIAYARKVNDWLYRFKQYDLAIA